MKTAIIIGSGFGGLAIAIRLAAKGVKVKIFEKNSLPGGHAYQLKKNGYTFDMGPSLITEVPIIESIFQSAGKDLKDYIKLVSLDPFYRVYFHDKSFFDYNGDPENMKQQLKKFNENDSLNYDKFMEYSKELYKAVIVDRLGSQPFITFSDMLGFLPRALKLNALSPVYKTVSKYFSDFRSRFMYSFHTLFIGGNPFRAPNVFLMLPYLEKEGGVWFSYGGMYSLVEALVKLFKELGGDLILDSEVEEILIENKKAVGVKVNGKEEKADIIISNGHFAHTYKDLIKKEYRKIWTDRKIEKKQYSMSCVVIYLGVKKQYTQLKHHTLILSERYKELLDDIFDKKVLADDFSMYLHAPTRTDSSMAPKGCESLYVLVPVPNLAGKTNWDKDWKKYSDKVVDFLQNDFGLEGLRENLEVYEVFTPKDFEEQRNNYLGAAWSLEPSLLQIANFRPHNVSEEFKNLYLVGVSTHPGGGVPGVMLSAETTEKIIVKEHNL